MNRKEVLFKWLDGILENQIPEEMHAIYINLVESENDVDVEFFGIGQFDPNDEDWACDDIFKTKSIEISFNEDISNIWKDVLTEVSSIIAEYLEINSDNTRLLLLKRVGVGFGDSETILVKNEI